MMSYWGFKAGRRIRAHDLLDVMRNRPRPGGGRAGGGNRGLWVMQDLLTEDACKTWEGTRAGWLEGADRDNTGWRPGPCGWILLWPHLMGNHARVAIHPSSWVA